MAAGVGDVVIHLRKVTAQIRLFIVAHPLHQQRFHLVAVADDFFNHMLFLTGEGNELDAPVFAKAMANWQSHATGNVNSIAQAAAVEAIGGDQSDVHRMVEEFRQRRDAMVARVNAIPRLCCRAPQGAFYVMVDIRQALGCMFGRTKLTDSMTFAQTLLANKAVAVVPGKAFEAEGMIRLSYALSMADLQRGLDRIEEFMNQLTME